MVDIEIFSLSGCAIDHLPDKSFVIRMYPLDYEFYGRLRSRVVFKNSQRFLGPENFSCRHDPAETAGVTQALGFRQVSFTFGEIAIEKAVLERHGRLRRQYVQDCQPSGCKDPRGQVVLKIQQRNQRTLFNERQAEDGTG